MREITYEAYKATVVLIALLETLWTNSRALAKMGRNTHVMQDLAKRFSKLHSRAERLNKEAEDLHFGEVDEDTGHVPGYHPSVAKALRRSARRMNRDARAVARFYDIPTKEMTASDILNYGTE